MLLLTGYDRGTPFSFKLGSGQVIKGFVQPTARRERVQIDAAANA